MQGEPPGVSGAKRLGKRRKEGKVKDTRPQPVSKKKKWTKGGKQASVAWGQI